MNVRMNVMDICVKAYNCAGGLQLFGRYKARQF